MCVSDGDDNRGNMQYSIALMSLKFYPLAYRRASAKQKKKVNKFEKFSGIKILRIKNFHFNDHNDL